ncbi:MAG TPA: STAS domain-containing protein [Terriglobales bacterium]|jgi:anti-anti-sigma factor|nr:STAS domain-containing protein [Terriglobales bacterium]
MPIEVKSYSKGDAGCLVLVGELDASAAPQVRIVVEEVLASKPGKLVLFVEELRFMASAGLRILIFAKQKQPEVQIYLIKPQATIVETLKKTGFYESVYVEQEWSDAAAQ